LPSEIIANTTARETRVALLENGRLAELHVDRGDGRGYVGNVYLGKVVRVLPGMQAAFVDIGLERAAFLYVGDIHLDVLKLEGRDGKGSKGEKSESRSSPKPGQAAIQDLLTEGQQVVVQVAKDPIGTKGARLTMHIALPGRYLVFMPTVNHVGISRRIDQDKERRRLRNIVERNRAKGAGYIVRTVCSGQSTETLKADMKFLETIWERVTEALPKKRAPALLHAEFDIVLRAVRDLFDEGVERVVLDDKKVYETVREFVEGVMPDAVERVHHYRGSEPVFDTYGVETEIGRSLGRKVWLKSGGYLVIDQTEALMAIDVNSGKFVGKSSLEDTTLRINMEAVDEVVNQLRLRNMGGIIIIDLIDMDREQNREQVYRRLEDALKKDRARTNVLRISDLGLVEMTRKRVQEGLDRYLREDCPTCGGTGYVRSKSTIAFDILREVKRENARANGVEAIYVNTTPAIADLLYGSRYQDLEAIERDIGKRIVVRALGHYHPEQYEVYVNG
jgi:ribonuclease G